MEVLLRRCPLANARMEAVLGTIHNECRLIEFIAP